MLRVIRQGTSPNHFPVKSFVCLYLFLFHLKVRRVAMLGNCILLNKIGNYFRTNQITIYKKG